MKFLIRWAIRFFIIFVVLVVALILLKDTILKTLAEYRLRSQTGLEVNIGRFETSWSSPRLTLENLKVYNSAEFGGSPLVDIPELHVECDMAALASQRLHLKLLRLNLNEINIVENKDGRTNIMELMDHLQKKDRKRSSHTNTAMGLEFQGIDALNLTVGKVKFMSLRSPGRNMELDVGLKNELLTNVKSMEDLSGLLLKVVFRNGFNLLSGSTRSPLGLLPNSAHLVTNFPKLPTSGHVILRKQSSTNVPSRR